MLRVNSVNKIFTGRSGREPVQALKNIDLHLEAGEFLSIVGPSGSGKSTLLFVLGAMLTPNSGEVSLQGQDLYSLGSRQRAQLRCKKIGFVFQTFNLIPYLNCLDNVATPAMLAGLPRKRARLLSASLLSRVGLGERLTHRPFEMSVGERQRVALCRSMVNSPDLLLADEPTGNLDPETTQQVMKLLLEFNQKGQTIILVSHDMLLAKAGMRTIRLERGEIQSNQVLRAEEATA